MALPGVFWISSHPNSISPHLPLRIFGASFHIKFPNQANFTHKTHGSREPNYWLYVCLLLLPDLRLHFTVFSTASYLSFSATAAEWKFPSCQTNAAEPQKRLLLVRRGSLPLYCGQRAAGLWRASLDHVSAPRETQNAWTKNALLSKRKF